MGISALKRSFKKIQKEWSSTEQASNEIVAKNFWRYLLSNPDLILNKYTVHTVVGHSK